MIQRTVDGSAVLRTQGFKRFVPILVLIRQQSAKSKTALLKPMCYLHRGVSAGGVVVEAESYLFYMWAAGEELIQRQGGCAAKGQVMRPATIGLHLVDGGYRKSIHCSLANGDAETIRRIGGQVEPKTLAGFMDLEVREQVNGAGALNLFLFEHGRYDLPYFGFAGYR